MNEQVKFALPSGFKMIRETNDEGNEAVRVVFGEYVDQMGETKYKFSCTVTVQQHSADAVDDGINSENLLDKLVERLENSRSWKLQATPETYFVNMGTPIAIFGRLIKMFACFCFVRVSDWSFLQIVSVTRINDDEPAENMVVYEKMYEVLQSVRIHDEAVTVEGVTPALLKQALELTFEEDGEDREKLSPSQEDLDRLAQMKASFPNYREILCEVHFLNALRRDLKNIYPAVKRLWDALRDERNYDEPLVGNEADVVYAWCALALDGKNYYASSEYVTWLKDSIQRDGTGTVKENDYYYTAYGYQVKWNSRMMMNQLYLYVEADDEWHIITVNNTFYNISSSSKVGIE